MMSQKPTSNFDDMDFDELFPQEVLQETVVPRSSEEIDAEIIELLQTEYTRIGLWRLQIELAVRIWWHRLRERLGLN